MTDALHALPEGTAVWKGHATGNTFVFVDDPDDRLDITPETVRALCDLKTGIGGDGLIRAVKQDGTWFMDYRNADGSLAEMCGNGIRSFVDHLTQVGFISIDEGDSLPVMTRGGLRTVWQVACPMDVAADGREQRSAAGGGPAEQTEEAGDLWYRVDMGPAVTTGEDDVAVQVIGLDGTFGGMRVAMPNPHTVIDVGDPTAVAAAVLPTTDVNEAPEVLRPTLVPDPVEGTNLELTADMTDTVADAGRGRLIMRVLERGVGETRSCGTGCCAAAVAAAVRAGADSPSEWIVDIPGGQVLVELPEDGPVGSEGSVYLTGPATRIARVLPA